MSRFKRVFPRADPARFTDLRLSNTAEICRDLEWFMMRFNLEISNEDRKRLEDGASEHREQASLLVQLMSGKRLGGDYDLAIKPRHYQTLPADIVLSRRFLLLCDDLGLGKTCEAICLLTRAVTRPALVVTATPLTTQWQREIAKFAPQLTTYILKKGTPYPISMSKKKPLPGQLSLISDFPDVIITNYAKLAGWAETLAPLIKTVVFDEVQELRRTESNKYSAAKHLANAAEFKLGLTATPIYNYGDEIFNVLDGIQEDCLGEKHEFLNEWGHYVGRESYAIRRPDAFGTYAREAGLMLRRTAAEVGIELPRATVSIQTISSDMDKLNSIESPAMELAKIIVSRSARARGDQFRSAGEFSRMVRQATGISKAPHVADFVRILADSGEKIVLWGWHHAVYDIWMERLKDLNPVKFTGEESDVQKRKAVEAFTEGDARVFIQSLRAGVGLDGLQFVCRIGVFGELDWSPQVMRQCGGRINRPGQERPVMLYYALSDEGADPVMADVLGVKQEQSDGILDPEDKDPDAYLDVNEEGIRRLAEQYLAKYGR